MYSTGRGTFFACASECRGFETAHLSMSLAVLEITLYTRLALNSQKSAFLCFNNAGIKGKCHQLLAAVNFSKESSKVKFGGSMCQLLRT